MSDDLITITNSDLKRIERLLDTKSNNALPGISMLRDELNRANVVTSEEIEPDFVTMNSTVRFVDELTNTAYQLTLVCPDQAGEAGTVSVLAPVGSALLCLRVGESISWQVPGGRQLRLRVVALIGQPESLQKYHR
jgi:regulator of nucleoside diphosphate kinase